MLYIVNIFHIQIEITYILLEKEKQKNVVNNILMILVGWVHIKNINNYVLEKEKIQDIIILKNSQVLIEL